MKKLMSLFTAVMLSVCLVTAPGCARPTTGWNFEQVAPIIRSTTTIFTQFAFNDPRVAPHREEICAATSKVVDFLNAYNDLDASFDNLKTSVLEMVNQLPPETLSNEAKQITLAITEFVLDSGWMHVRDNYLGLLAKDESRIVVLLAKSIADGIQAACGTSVTTMTTVPELNTYFEKYTP